MTELINLQLTMFAMIFAGMMLKRIGMIGEEGKKNITDLVIYVILPCNIIKSFMVEFSMDILYSFAAIFLISILIQICCTIGGHVLYNRESAPRKKCLQYGTICSNAGFLGNPIAEGVFGTMGLTLASIFLIPQRIVMWSAGISVFTESPDRKTLLKKVITHPCILACLIGVVLLLTQFELPSFMTSVITTFGNCNTAMSMMVIGMILAEIDLRTLFDKTIIYYMAWRLLLIPAIVYVGCILFHVNTLVTGVSVLLTAMPAGATTSILAAKYDGDARFAVRMVVSSTLISLITIPLWSAFLTF